MRSGLVQASAPPTAAIPRELFEILPTRVTRDPDASAVVLHSLDECATRTTSEDGRGGHVGDRQPRLADPKYVGQY